jgi:hypothetical protein
VLALLDEEYMRACTPTLGGEHVDRCFI